MGEMAVYKPPVLWYTSMVQEPLAVFCDTPTLDSVHGN